MTCYAEGQIKYGTGDPCCEGLVPVFHPEIHRYGEDVCEKVQSQPDPKPNIALAVGIIIILGILYSMFAKR